VKFLSKNLGNMPLKHYLQYLVIGFLTTVISFGSFWVLIEQVKFQPNWANIISVMLAVAFAYIANKVVVFRSKCSDLRVLVLEIFRFILTRIIAIIVEIVGVYLLYSIFSMSAILAKIYISVIIIVINYLSFKHLVFRE